MTETEEPMMTEVVSVKFRQGSTAYYFDPRGIRFERGGKAIVETAKGMELCTVTQANHMVPNETVVQPLRPVIREATAEDLALAENCRGKEKEAFAICRQKIANHGLEMKLINVEYNFDGSKIVFYFSSDGRVDFRELVKDLASVFHTRIELRQIGVRDEARILGGLGICGRPFCCCYSMQEFQPVSTKMAKTQSMSLNPAKISGACGRLMCCLRYEQPAYEELVKNVPKNGAFVETPDGYGNVTQVNVLRQTVKVRMDSTNGGDVEIRKYDADEVAAIPGGRPRDGAELPHVLQLKPKKAKEPEEEKDDYWRVPDMLIASPEELSRRTEQTSRFDRREFAAQANNRSRNRKRSEAAPSEPREQKPRPPRGQRPKQEPAENAANTVEPSDAAAAAAPQHKRSRHRKRGPRPEGVPNTAAPQNEKPRSAENHNQRPRRNPQNANHPEAKKPDPQKSAAAPQAQSQPGEQKKRYNNHRRNYRPRPKKNGDGTPKQGE